MNTRNSIFVMPSKALNDHMFQRGLLLGNLTTSKLLMGNLGTRKCWPLTLQGLAGQTFFGIILGALDIHGLKLAKTIAAYARFDKTCKFL